MDNFKFILPFYRISSIFSSDWQIYLYKYIHICMYIYMQIYRYTHIFTYFIPV